MAAESHTPNDEFQSTLSVRRATYQRWGECGKRCISIHALRKESDGTAGTKVTFGAGISIHALRKESDHVKRRLDFRGTISIHALRKESDSPYRLPTGRAIISIHALRKESDSPIIISSLPHKNFNPRSP